MSYTRITVKSAISSMRPAAIVFTNGEDKSIIDGITPEMLRGIAKMFKRAADHLEGGEDTKADHGASQFGLSYEIEWGQDTFQWEDTKDDTDHAGE